jgi:hypothetical protein
VERSENLEAQRRDFSGEGRGAANEERIPPTAWRFQREGRKGHAKVATAMMIHTFNLSNWLAREARRNDSSLTIDGTVKTLQPSRPLRILRDLCVEFSARGPNRPFRRPGDDGQEDV